MGMIRLFLIFSITTFVVAMKSEAKENSSLSIKKEVSALSLYMNSFDKINDLIEDLAHKGVFSQAEKLELYSFLDSKKIKISDPILKAQANGNSLKWSADIITFLDDGSYQNKEGKFLRFHQNHSFTERLEKTWSFLNPQKSFSFFGIFLSTANASDQQLDAAPTLSNKLMEFLGITVNATYIRNENPISRPVATLGGFLFWPAGLAEGLAQRYLWPTRNLMGGKITCGENNTFKAEVLDYASWIESYNYWKESPKGKSSCDEQYDSNNYCAFLRANIDFATQFVVKDKTAVISESTLKKYIFPGQTIPKCDDKSIATVKTYLEKRLKSTILHPVTVIPQDKKVESTTNSVR